MRRPRHPLPFVAAFLAIACVPPQTRTHAPVNELGAKVPATGKTASALPVVDDLGPAEVDATSEGEPVRTAIAFKDTGPERLLGSRGDGRRRPSAPGNAGQLRVAIDTPYQLFGRASSYLHLVAWREDGRPAAGSRVFVGRRSVGRTNADGTLVFRYNKPKSDDADGGFSSQETLFVIDGNGRCGAAEFTPYQRTESFASDQLYIYTDRGVYRPGETVHVRAIGWRLEADYVPIVGGDVELVLRDRSGHSIAAATIHTDEFGTGDADLEVPLTADAGDYDLAIAYGTARETTDLQIRRFQSPQLRIDHTLPRHITRDVATLDFTVDARPTTGGALGKAHLEIELSSPTGHVTKIERDISGKGPHAFTIAKDELAALRKDVAEGASIRAAITVRDARGRQDSALRFVSVASNPYVAVLEPDKDAYSTGDEVVVVARVSDIDDVAVRGRAVVFVRGDKTELTATTDDRGFATFRFPMPSRPQDLELRIADVETALTSAHLAWQEAAAMMTTLDAPVVRERTTVKLTARFPRGHEPADRRVHVDLTDTSGAIVGATVLRATKHKDGWVATGQIEAPTWGSSLFTFFALGKGELDPREKGSEPQRGKLGLLVAGQQIAVVPDRELEIELRDVPERAAPGDALEVAAVVRDRRGRSVEFAATAALVDSAVLALNDPLEVTPMDRFYDPDLRTLATTGAQMLTWPVVTRNWGDNRWDVALPPFAFLGPGESTSCRDHWDAQDIRVAEAMVSGAGGLGLFGTGSGGGGTGEGTIGLGSVGTIGHGGRGAAVPKITVRKRFSDTSLWDATLKGRGEATIRATLPDTIGEQELVVVASDRGGGVGVARKRISVDQPLFVEADLPDVMIAGETLEIPVVVQNRTKANAAIALSLRSGSAAARTAQIDVGQGDTGGAALRLTALPVGTGRVVVEASDKATHLDRVERDVQVIPAGVPITTRRTEIARKDTPAKFTVEGSENTTAHLRIDVPAVTAAFIGLDALLATISDDPWALAGDLSSAAILLKLADRHGTKGPQIDALRKQLVAAVAMTARVQRDNGAFAYWRNGAPSPYVTALVLDGLLDAREAGVRVPAKTIAAAAKFVGDELPTGKLAAMPDIGWWEGDDAQTRRAIESEILAVLARLEAREQKDITGPLAAMMKRALETLRTSHDVRAIAGAVTGLSRLGAMGSLRDVAKRLVAARDDGHWEPTWFSAWGGTIEATAAVLEILAAASDTEFAEEKRDGLRWLLATRDSWGTWHNERGTVAALRAIAAVGAPRIEGTTVVVVRAGDEVIARAQLDAADPLAGARALAHLDLPIAATAGKHRIVVEVSGPVAPSVTLVESRWNPGTAGRASRGGLVLEASGKPKLTAGAASTMTITAKGRQLGGATIRIAHSGLVDVDLAELAEQIGRGGPIAELRRRADGIELRIAPTTSAIELTVPVLGHRRGTGHWPAVALTPSNSRGVVPQSLAVDPGALVVE